MVLENTLQQKGPYTLESGTRTKYVPPVRHKWLTALWLLTLSVCASPRCVAKGPCSTPLEHSMKENSKTTCTTAQGPTRSQMDLRTEVTFMRTGRKQSVFSSHCHSLTEFPPALFVMTGIQQSVN